MSYSVILPVSFEVLDPAVAENLTYFVEGFIEHERNEITRNSTVYFLKQEELGEIGELRLRKLVNEKSEFYVKDASLPLGRDITKEEKLFIRSKATDDERRRAIVEISRNIRNEKRDLKKKRASHLLKLSLALLARIQSDPFTWPPTDQRLDTLEKYLEGFCSHVKEQIRMSFWQNRDGKHVWVSSPEKYAKSFLQTYLSGKLGDAALVFPEVPAGAGKIDLLLVQLGGEEAVIELKMCGHGYSLGYARGGIDQIRHYMDNNRNVRSGYLIIFDSRSRDYGKAIPQTELSSVLKIITKTVDIRPKVREEVEKGG